MTLEEFSSISDSDLYERCCKMDQTAWAYLYNYVLSITRWPRWNLGHESEDIAQTVALSLMEKGLELLKEETSFRSFVKRVTVNRILDHYKKKKGVPLSSEGQVMDKSGKNPQATLGSSDPGPEDHVGARGALSVFLSILKDLPEYCRRVIKRYMAYQMGEILSYEEMAQGLNLSVSTVGVQIKRCKDMIRQDERFRDLLD